MTLFIWDMSHFQTPSIGTAVAEGITAITHKAGGDGNDVDLAAWWFGVKGLRPGLLVGAYWVLYPGTPAARADAFLARLDSQCPGWRDQPFLLQVDCEKWGGDPSTAPPKADIKAFCDRLVAQVPKLRPVVYAPAWVYGDTLSGLGYPLWASIYVTGTGGFKTLYPGDNSTRWAPYSGQTPAFLQYTDSAEVGGQHPCDASAYRGTLAQLHALVAPGWEDDMPLTTTDIQAVAAAVVKLIRTTYPVLSDSDKNSVAGLAAAQVGAHLDPQLAGLLTAVNGEAAAVLSALGDAGRTPQDLADILAPVLGAQAAAVGAALLAHKSA